jgi:threonine/homoserine efflux transporter RhtA
MVGTYAYVNPLVAILVGWLLGGEELTVSIIAGLVVILAGVALVRAGGLKVKEKVKPERVGQTSKAANEEPNLRPAISDF